MPSAPPSSELVSEMPDAAPARSGGALPIARSAASVNSGARPSERTTSAGHEQRPAPLGGPDLREQRDAGERDDEPAEHQRRRAASARPAAASAASRRRTRRRRGRSTARPRAASSRARAAGTGRRRPRARRRRRTPSMFAPSARLKPGRRKSAEVDHRVGEAALAVDEGGADREPGDRRRDARPARRRRRDRLDAVDRRRAPRRARARRSTRSSRPGSGSRYSGSSRGPTTSSSTITGTASRNTEPHQKLSSSTPPTSGPIAAPTEKLVIQIADRDRALPVVVEHVADQRQRRGRERRAGDAEQRARRRSASPGSTQNAASTEAAPNAAAPISSSRRRPIRSPSVPIVIRKPATRKP